VIAVAIALVPSLALSYSPVPRSSASDEAVAARSKELQPLIFAAEDTPRRIVQVTSNPGYENPPISYAGSELNFVLFTELVNYLADMDAVLIGEEHDDPASHRLELEIEESLRPLYVGMEMFERDVQPAIDDYFEADMSSEAEARFFQNSRPWSNYSRDYRPVVESLNVRSDSLYGSNAPTPIARRVAKEGLETVLNSLSPEERKWVAETTTSPKDEYWRRFLEAMGGGGSASDSAHGMGMTEEQIYGFYQAQCLKDDTMAETIARLREEDPQRQVVHLSGSFHIDYHLGIYPRLAARRPSDKIVTVAIRPVENFDEATLKAALEAEPGVADYVVFVLKEVEPVPSPVK
jgi:uncharacterized iron-regulated protein